MRVYYDLADIYLHQDSAHKALEYMQKELEISKANNQKRFELAGMIGLSVIYSDKYNDYDKAMKYANEALTQAETFGDRHVIFAALCALSNAYRELRQYRDCESTALKAWEIDSINLDDIIPLAANIALSNIYLDNKGKATRFFEKYEDLVKQYTKKSFHEILVDMDVKYETEKKEMHIAALEKEKELYIWLGIAGLAVLLLAFGMLFYRHRLNVQKRKMAEQQKELAERNREMAEQQVKQLEQEKQLVAAQSVLDGETAERSRLARDLHDGLGGMLSVMKLNLKNTKSYAVMESEDVDHFIKATEILDQSIGELRRVAHHLMPESLMRYGLRVSLEDFCHAVPGAEFQYLGAGSRLDNRMEVLIYRCAYELINNAVKHSRATAINVQLLVDEGLVSLTVSDNGVGFDPETIVAGAGLENIRTRVSAYNGKMHIRTAQGKGTEINIEIEKSEE